MNLLFWLGAISAIILIAIELRAVRRRRKIDRRLAARWKRFTDECGETNNFRRYRKKHLTFSNSEIKFHA